ncbi:MAG: hypothetical protein KC933_10965 [Myxococcales bacterium]|nr:hypothetical protein [Myxococcales bacterium]
MSAPPGIDCGGDCTQSWTHGTSVLLTATSGGGSSFGLWTQGPCVGSAEPTCEFEVTSPVEVAASFDRNLLTAAVVLAGDGDGTVTSGDGAIACGPGTAGTCSHGYAVGTTLSFQASARPGSRFVQWGGACSGTTTCTVVLNNSASVTAVFERITHELTISLSGPGRGRVAATGVASDCRSTCMQVLPEGTMVTLTATPDEHYRFTGWSGACGGHVSTCQVTMDQARTVDARFEFTPKLVAGFWHVCATNDSGSLRCWGQNDFGQLGYGNTMHVGGPSQPTPISMGDVPVGGLVKDIAIGGFHTCALLQDGGVRCWGQGDSGQLGYGSVASRGGAPSTVPAMGGNVSLSGVARGVAAGFAHTCVLLESGDVQCWGTNARGQLGYGDIASVGQDTATLPSVVGAVPVGGPARQIVSGGLFTCAVLTTDVVRCWGTNQNGYLGYGIADDAVVGAGRNNTPAAAGDVPVGGLVDHLTATGGHTCAVLQTGGVRCWGLGLDGRLGYGSGNDVGHSGLTPAMMGDVNLGAGLVAIAAGQTQTCGLFNGGVLKCWGDGVRGALGYGPPNDDIGDAPGEISPTLAGVEVGGSVASVAPGGFFTCARLTTGVIRCWGEGGLGGLGNGLQSWTDVAAGSPAVPVF